MNTYDIVVIGAGPAGSMAAWNAAERGKKVCLIERKAEPGIPYRCGEGIGFRGLTAAIEPRPEWIKSTVKKAAMISPNGRRVDIGQMSESIVLDRERMDNDLAKEAVKKGATLLTSTTITSIKQHGTFEYECIGPDVSIKASIVILADGIESKLARNLGWRTSLSLSEIETCAFARVTSPLIDSDTVIFYTGGDVAPGGYAWVFPRGRGNANVGLGVLGSNSSAGKALDLLKKFIDREFPGSRMADLHCGGVPVSKWVRPLVRDGAMLVGDAARQVNCLSGAGIAYSLWAGKTAGTVAAEALSTNTVNGSHLKKYEQLWKKKYGKLQDRSYTLKEFVRKTNDKFLDNIASTLVKEDPSKLNYLRVFLKTFSKHPILLFKAFKLFK